MSALTVSGFVAESAEGRKDLIARLRRDLTLAVNAALCNHGAWRDALAHMRDSEESNIAYYAMKGDQCEAGKTLHKALERIVKERASDNAKEAIYQRYGIDLDEERS